MEFDFGSLFGGLLFSTLGFAIFRIGKNQARPLRMGVGVLLIVLPWVLSSGWGLWGAGLLLTALGFVL